MIKTGEMKAGDTPCAYCGAKCTAVVDGIPVCSTHRKHTTPNIKHANLEVKHERRT